MPFDVTKYGALGDGKTIVTEKLQAAIDACAAAGGGTVVVPAGTFVVGSLWMRSHVTLHLEAGAVLLGSEREEDFPLWASKWEGPEAVKWRAALIAGEGLDTIAVTGRGTIDGRGKVWWQRHYQHIDCPRPHLIRVVDCKNVLIEGITLRNSPFWTVSPLACDNLTVTNITITNPSNSPNTDGINPDSCSNVRISNCHIDVGDDCITIKSGKETDGRQKLKACENIAITNCTLVHGHGGVVIGSEMSGCVRNVAISNCVFVGTDRGIRLKARRGRGGVVEDIRVSNLVMDGVLCPIAVNLFYGCGNPTPDQVDDKLIRPVDSTTPRFRRIRFSNITALRAKCAAVFILGLPEMFVEDIALHDVMIRLDPDNTTPGEPDMSPIIGGHFCRNGMMVRNTRGFVLRNVEIAEQDGSALSMTDCEQVNVAGFIAHTAADGAAIKLRGVRDAILRGCRVADGFHSSLHISSSRTRNVRLGDDSLNGTQVIDIDEEVGDGEVIYSGGSTSGV